MNVIVKHIHAACLGIKVLDLVALDGQPLPVFTAGAHIDVHLGNGLVRQYSLCNNPAQRDCYSIGVLLDSHSRGGSQFVHDHIQVGDELQISEPRNLFVMSSLQKKALLLAGGIGITPLMAMAETLTQEEIDFELYYFCKSAEAIAFSERLSQSHWVGKVHFVHENSQHIPELLSRILHQAHVDTHLYTCGPTGFMDAVFAAALQQAWQPENLHKESFEAMQIDASSNLTFKVQIASTGDMIDIPCDQSITEVLEQKGYFIPVSCEQGICGTCITNVLSGEPEHCDQFLTDEEKASNKILMPCCSRSRSGTLVLDL